MAQRTHPQISQITQIRIQIRNLRNLRNLRMGSGCAGPRFSVFISVPFSLCGPANGLPARCRRYILNSRDHYVESAGDCNSRSAGLSSVGDKEEAAAPQLFGRVLHGNIDKTRLEQGRSHFAF